MKKFVQIRTRNHTARPLRRSILFDKWAIVRLGSRTPTEECSRRPRNFIEVNTIEAVENSRSKLRMKVCFNKLKVPQAELFIPSSFSNNGLVNNKNVVISFGNLDYPIVAKRVFGFQGRGMSLFNNPDEFRNWRLDHEWKTGWIFERFYNYAREYRLHVSSASGVFLSWRKLRTKNAKDRWFFNSTNSMWVGEAHETFDKPKCWAKMEKAAVNALKATGLDIGAVDIRVQSNKQPNPKFIVCEINSAPALGNDGIEAYKEEILKILNKKSNGATKINSR